MINKYVIKELLLRIGSNVEVHFLLCLTSARNSSIVRHRFFLHSYTCCFLFIARSGRLFWRSIGLRHRFPARNAVRSEILH